MGKPNKSKLSLTIIAVVIVILVAYFVIKFPLVNAPIYTPICVPYQGYNCTNQVLSTTGIMSLQFSQNSSQIIYNLEFACTALATNNGNSPDPVSAFTNITTSMLQSNILINISDLPCYNNKGELLGDIPTGTTLAGFIWLNYTISPLAPSFNNTWRTAKVATFTVKAT